MCPQTANPPNDTNPATMERPGGVFLHVFTGLVGQSNGEDKQHHNAPGIHRYLRKGKVMIIEQKVKTSNAQQNKQ